MAQLYILRHTHSVNPHLTHTSRQVLKVRELLRRRNLGGVRVGTVDDYQVGCQGLVVGSWWFIS